MTSQEWSSREAQDNFERQIPEHACEGGADCVHPGAFYLFVTDDDDSVNIASGTHGASPHMVLQAMVQTLDTLFLESKPDRMPAMIAWTHARESIKQVAETLPAPGEVSFSIDEFMQSMIDELGGEDSDE